MISRRDNLLVRPWQQRRYENHRRKVQSAMPAIDTKPPLHREHVAVKLKKQQKELERCQQIEKNNYNLVKRLCYVMRTNRVDNAWITPQPNFLNRISMYHMDSTDYSDVLLDYEPTPPPETSRKLKCLACSPQKHQELEFYEERIPWETKKAFKPNDRSRSVPSRRPDNERIKAPKSAPKLSDKTHLNKSVLGRAAQSISLSRGCLKLSINFPSDTLVKLQDRHQEKILIQNICNCSCIGKVSA